MLLYFMQSGKFPTCFVVMDLENVRSTSVLSKIHKMFGATTEYRAIFSGLKQKWLGGSLVTTSV